MSVNRTPTAPKSHRSFKADIGYEPDGCWEGGAQKVWVEVKPGTHSFRNVRASVLGLAYLLTLDQASRALLVLPDSRISKNRQNAEWHLIEQTLRPDVAQRLALVVTREGDTIGLPPDLERHDDFRPWLELLVDKESQRGSNPRQFYEEILKVMIRQRWLVGKPVTTDWITRMVGCSYPTAAAAIQRLGYVVVRHTNRMSLLRMFPRDEWNRLVSIADEVRGTKRFVDRSGQPRSPQSLLRRLATLRRSDLAIGGIEGARHYKPDIDLAGMPRLDISLHCPKGRIDWSFVERLDPALKETTERNASTSLVVHVVRRSESFFELDKSGIQWADPVECLLDLHEARLEPQAKELLNYFEKGVGARA